MSRYQEIIDRSYVLAEAAHKNQVRRSGEPYFNHCKRVLHNTLSYLHILEQLEFTITAEEWAAYQIIALNHDHLEDNPDHYHKHFLPFLWSERESCPELYIIFHEVKNAIDAISKKPKGQENYSDYVLRVKRNHFARIVKLQDLFDNMRDLDPGNLRDKYELTKWVLEN